MKINDLPDDCLIKIFENLLTLNDLCSAYNAYTRWQDLVTTRMKQIKYAFGTFDPQDVRPSRNIIYLVHTKGVNSPILFNEPLARALKGYIMKGLESKFPWICFDIQMYAANEILRKFLDYRSGPKLRQLTLFSCNLQVLIANHEYLLNLRSLFIEHFEIGLNSGLSSVCFPLLDTLILQGDCCKTKYFPNMGFALADCCPRLKSIYLLAKMQFPSMNIKVVNEQLVDLVIQFTELIKWDESDSVKLATKYPNVKHLALRNNHFIRKCHVMQLVKQFNHLEILDLKFCPLVNARSADLIDKYNKRNNKSIIFHLNPLPIVDQPKPEYIGIGTFMEARFYRTWSQQPYFVETRPGDQLDDSFEVLAI